MSAHNPLRHARRSRSDWNLFLRAYSLVWFIRIALWICPFKLVQRWAGKLRQRKIADQALGSQSVYKVIWAVSAASRRVPKATCLTQALATQILLGRRGCHTDLHFGAKKNGEKLDAHAWIEQNGRILIGFNVNLNDLSPFKTVNNDTSEFNQNGG